MLEDKCNVEHFCHLDCMHFGVGGGGTGGWQSLAPQIGSQSRVVWNFLILEVPKDWLFDPKSLNILQFDPKTIGKTLKSRIDNKSI